MNTSIDIDKITHQKHATIANIKNSRSVTGIPAHLARVAVAGQGDLALADKVDGAIRDFVRDHAEDGFKFEDYALEDLHKWLPVDLLSACQDYVTKELQSQMMEWAVHVGAYRLGLPGNFYVDREVYVRINYPFDAGTTGTPSTIAEPSHRLTTYNKGRPRATWGHGPHKDSWYGHSHSAINLWFSVCGANEQSTMTTYPEHAYRATAFNPDSMYASYSENLGANIGFALDRGENFIFDPELLHSTRLNTSNQTRVVLTLRLSADEPVFSDSVQHDIYDLWMQSDDILAGVGKATRVGKRVAIDDYPETVVVQQSYVHRINDIVELSQEDLVRDTYLIEDNVIFEIEGPDINCLGVWDAGTLYKFSKTCPHVGAPLLGSYFDVSKLSIKCPAHGVEFCIKTGESGSQKLKLKVM